MARDSDDLEYRSAIPDPPAERRFTTNEGEYSTLRIVRGQLANAVERLYKDFNAFDPKADAPKAEAMENLLRQVEVNQAVYAILAPLLDSINTAMVAVDRKHKAK